MEDKHSSLKEDNGLESMVICNLCSMYIILPSNPPNYTCNKCKLIQLLEDKIEFLQNNLKGNQKNRPNTPIIKPQREKDLQTQTPKNIYNLEEENGINSPEQETKWIHVTYRKKNNPTKKPPPAQSHLQPSPLPISNKYTSLQTQENQPTNNQETPKKNLNKAPSPAITAPKKFSPLTNPIKRNRRVLVIGDSILEGTETTICRPDKQTREISKLPGAKISDITQYLNKIIKPTDYYPLLVIQAGTNDTEKDLNAIKRDYDQLGNTIKNTGAQAVFSSTLPTTGWNPANEHKIQQINQWLKDWCRQKNFGFLDHGLQFYQDGLLTRDGLQLTRAGKNLLGNRLAHLIKRALN